jgi:hypothetical protein
MQVSTCRKGASENSDGLVSCRECSYLGSTVVQAVYSKEDQSFLQSGGSPCNANTSMHQSLGALNNSLRVLYGKGWVHPDHQTTQVFISNTSKTVLQLQPETFDVTTMVKFAHIDDDDVSNSQTTERVSNPVRFFFGSAPRRDIILTLEIHLNKDLNILSARRMLNHTLRTQWFNFSSGLWVSVCTEHGLNMDDRTLTAALPLTVLHDASFLPRAVKCTLRDSDPDCESNIGGVLSAAFVNISDCSDDHPLITLPSPSNPSSLNSLDYILAGIGAYRVFKRV